MQPSQFFMGIFLGLGLNGLKQRITLYLLKWGDLPEGINNVTIVTAELFCYLVDLCANGISQIFTWTQFQLCQILARFSWSSDGSTLPLDPSLVPLPPHSLDTCLVQLLLLSQMTLKPMGRAAFSLLLGSVSSSLTIKPSNKIPPYLLAEGVRRNDSPWWGRGSGEVPPGCRARCPQSRCAPNPHVPASGTEHELVRDRTTSQSCANPSISDNLFSQLANVKMLRCCFYIMLVFYEVF